MPDANPGWRGRKLDALLAICLFGFILGWLSADLPSTLGLDVASVALYATTIDPFHHHMPRHIELTIGLASFVYGPAYVALLWGLWRDAPWVWKLALPIAGLLFGTTLIYMTASLTSETPPLNLPAFLGLNGPYLLVSLLLIVRFTRDPRPAEPR